MWINKQRHSNENKNIHQKTDLNKKLSMLDADYNVLKLERRQRVVEFLEKENPELQKIVDVCLDPKYKYADPLQKAKSIPYLKVKWDYFRFKNVDFENIQKGLWWECASNAILMLHDLQLKWIGMNKFDLNFAVWHDSSWFASEWSKHVFALLKVWSKQIIFDPSFKEISFLEESWYEINDLEEVNLEQRFSEESSKLVDESHKVWSMTLDYVNQQIFWEIKEYLPLWFIEDWEYLILYSVAKVNESFHTIVLSIRDVLWNENVSFLDKDWESVHRKAFEINKNVNDVLIWILRHFEKNWTLK